MTRLCVFCGSSMGARPAYAEMAQALGRELAARQIGLVYGGASRGLMGVVADAALAAGGEVLGVLPRGLFAREVAHSGLTHLYEVESMHERKALMSELADGFIALPGGYGTLDELFEIVTWAQIGIHTKPIGLLDVDEYFVPLLSFVERAAAEGFIPSAGVALMQRATDPSLLIDQLVRQARQAERTPPPTTPGEPLPKP